jgi:hypothetical protein
VPQVRIAKVLARKVSSGGGSRLIESSSVRRSFYFVQTGLRVSPDGWDHTRKTDHSRSASAWGSYDARCRRAWRLLAGYVYRAGAQTTLCRSLTPSTGIGRSLGRGELSAREVFGWSHAACRGVGAKSGRSSVGKALSAPITRTAPHDSPVAALAGLLLVTMTSNLIRSSHLARPKWSSFWELVTLRVRQWGMER